jgi:hypothetical protein
VSGGFGDDPRLFRADRLGELEFLLLRQDGVLAWRQARRFLSEKAVRHRVRSGRWRLAHRAVYLAYNGPVTVKQRRWIASLAVGNGRPALLAGSTALTHLGLRGWPETAIHLLVPAQRADTDPPTGVIVHRTRRLTRRDVHFAGTPPCTMPARSMIDAAQWAATDAGAVTVVAATFQQRLVDLGDVRPVLATMKRLRRRAVIEAAVADASSGAESAYEIDFARLCRRAGLPEPSRQAFRTDRNGRRRYRDVFFDEWRVHVEIDGSQHMDVRAWYADMRQGNEIAISGVRLLRFPGWAVRHHPDEVIADLRAALIAAGWHP